LTYLRALLAEVKERRSFDATVEHDQVRERVRTMQITVGNGSRFGGGMMLAEAGSYDDGVLHVCNIAPANLSTLVALLFRLGRGSAKAARNVRIVRTPEATVRTAQPMPVSAGGERITQTPVHFHILPGALRIYSPRTEETS
jgi:diacylglycerol kinase family enzyme